MVALLLYRQFGTTPPAGPPLAIDDIEPAAYDDRGTGDGRHIGQVSEEEIPPEHCPWQGNIFERRRDVRLGQAVALRQEEEAEGRDKTASRHQGEVTRTRPQRSEESRVGKESGS